MMEKKLKKSALAVLDYMIEHETITVQECILHCHTTELRSRISELKGAGYIISDTFEKQTEPGRHPYKRYKLEGKR